jgi:hypothetical protein
MSLLHTQARTHTPPTGANSQRRPLKTSSPEPFLNAPNPPNPST